MTVNDVIDEMLAFGIRFEIAEIVAPAIMRLENDPRGFRQALIEEEPLIAERIGAIKLN